MSHITSQSSNCLVSLSCVLFVKVLDVNQAVFGLVMVYSTVLPCFTKQICAQSSWSLASGWFLQMPMGVDSFPNKK